MQISNLLTEDRILPVLQARSKEGVLMEMAQLLAASDPLLAEGELFEILMERETLGTTGIGDGVAIPHGKMKGLPQMLVGFGKSANGVQFDALDGLPAHFFFLLLAPEDSAEPYLRVLAQITRVLKKVQVRNSLMRATTKEEILGVFAEAEKG